MAKKTLAEKMAENSKAVYEGMKTNTISSFSSTENIKKNIIVLDELRDLIPPLLDVEFLALKDNLLKHGCKDPLKIWQTNNRVIGREGNLDEPIYVLIDGHNRFQLCTELQIPFNIQIDNFESLKEVRDFMIDFQLSRRNITPQQASYLRGLRYNTEKKAVTDNLKSISTDVDLPNGQNVHLGDFVENVADSEAVSGTDLPNGQNVHLANKTNKTTAQELGEYFNVDEKTIRRDAEFALGLDKLDPTLRKDILNGNVKVEKAKIQKIVSELTTPAVPVSESPVSTIVTQRYEEFNAKLQKVYKAKKIKSTEIESLKTAFQAFIDAL